MKCERLAKATETSTYLFWGIPRKWDGRDDGPAYAWTSALGFDWDTGYISCSAISAVRFTSIIADKIACIAIDVTLKLTMRHCD